MTIPPPATARIRRAPTAVLALGAYSLLLGIVFSVPFMQSALAQQNDVFLTNLLLGVVACLLGGVALVVGIGQMAELKPGLATSAAILSAALILSGLAALLWANAYAVLAPLVAACTALLFALCTLVAARHARLAAWARALLVAAAGAGLVTCSYALFGGRYHDAYGIATYLPRYLDGTTSGLSLLLGIAVYAVARAWASRA